MINSVECQGILKSYNLISTAINAPPNSRLYRETKGNMNQYELTVLQHLQSLRNTTKYLKNKMEGRVNNRKVNESKQLLELIKNELDQIKANETENKEPIQILHLPLKEIDLNNYINKIKVDQVDQTVVKKREGHERMIFQKLVRNMKIQQNEIRSKSNLNNQ